MLAYLTAALTLLVILWQRRRWLRRRDMAYNDWAKSVCLQLEAHAGYRPFAEKLAGQPQERSMGDVLYYPHDPSYAKPKPFYEEEYLQFLLGERFLAPSSPERASRASTFFTVACLALLVLAAYVWTSAADVAMEKICSLGSAGALVAALILGWDSP